MLKISVAIFLTRRIYEDCLVMTNFTGGDYYVLSSSLARYFWMIYSISLHLVFCRGSRRLRVRFCRPRACSRWSVRKIHDNWGQYNCRCSIDQSNVKMWFEAESKNETTFTPLHHFPMISCLSFPDWYSRTLNIWLALRSWCSRDYTANDNILSKSKFPS